MQTLELHSQKQTDAFFSDHDITIVGTGIQWGKTTVGALWLKRIIHSNPNPENNFLVVSPTYKILNQSTLPPFLKFMNGLGEYNKSEAVFRFTNGPTVYFRTNHDPDSVVGITNVRGIWGDEAGKFTLYFWENIEGRAAFCNAPIMFTTSPYSLNWLHTDLIKPHLEGKRPDVKYVKAASVESPYFPKAVYYKRKETMDPRRFLMMYGGEFGHMVGLVYDCFDQDIQLIDPHDLPAGTRFFGGIDWGYTEPCSIGVRAITPEGLHYRVSETYKTGMTITKIIEACQQKMKIFNIKCFYCGPDQPGYIEELNRNKIPAIAADNDVRRGVDLHYELIQSNKYFMFKSAARYALDEYLTYHYPEPKDLKPDQAAKEQKPVGQNDHAMDQERYITIMTYRRNQLLIPKTPDESPKKRLGTREQELNRLKKAHRRSAHTESFS